MALIVTEQQLPKRVEGAVKKVLELYKAGYSVREIARLVYGDDSRICIRRASVIISLYGKRLGLLDSVKRYDEERGEFVDAETGTVVGNEVRDGYVPHSSPVHPQDPFLGSYRTMQQLRASLSPGERRAVDILMHVDRLMGLLPDIPRESVIRQDACLLARRNAHLKVWVSKIAVTCVLTSLMYHVPKRVGEFLNLVPQLFERLNPVKAVRECFEAGFTVPQRMVGVIMINAVAGYLKR